MTNASGIGIGTKPARVPIELVVKGVQTPDNRRGLYSFGGRLLVLTCAIAILLSGGCGQSTEIPDDYGTLSNKGTWSSVNGTSVLAGIFRQRGNKVVIDRRITPRVERYGAIVWFAQKGSECPNPDVSQRINKWLDNDSSRKLLYVGWDAEAASGFWSDAAKVSSGASAQSLMRRRARAMADADAMRGLATGVAPAGCDWFQIKKGDRIKLDRLKNRGSAPMDVSNGTVELGTVRLVPPPGSFSNIILASEDGVPVMFSAASTSSGYRSNVIVVTNSSFLLNYSLLNPTNRKVATRVLDELGTIKGPILFLHSGDVGFSDTIYEKQTAWSWINQPPVRYIVPHILAIGLIFIFSVFPVLGRPKALERELQPGLGRHVDAVGELIVRSSKTAEAEYWLKSKISANRTSKNTGTGKRVVGQQKPIGN